MDAIFNALPHRYPFLLVDRVISCVPGEKIVALKNVTINEPFFSGHFPGFPVMPGVLIIEAMAQTAGLLLAQSSSLQEKEVYYLAGVDRARFRSPVHPGDSLMIHVSLLTLRKTVSKYEGSVFCGDRLVSEAELLCASSSHS